MEEKYIITTANDQQYQHHHHYSCRLAQFDGTDERKPTYFASDGYVWDVSTSTMFTANSYGQWWKGKDASVLALAKMSMDPKDANRTDWENMNQQDINVLQSWTKYFEQKYYITGRLQEYDQYQQQQQQQQPQQGGK
jgi:predicted heme/steroid binding protein